jgi:integrase
VRDASRPANAARSPRSSAASSGGSTRKNGSATTRPPGSVRRVATSASSTRTSSTRRREGRDRHRPDDIMDRVGVLLLLRAGLRQAELRGLRVRDVNLVEKYVLVVRGKGGKPRRVPIKGELVRSLEELMLTDVEGLNRPRRVTEYLLCPKRRPHAGACSWPADVEAWRARMVVSLPTPRRSRRGRRLVGSEDARGTAHLCDRSRAGDRLEPRRCPEEPRPRVAADDGRHLHAFRVR